MRLYVGSIVRMGRLIKVLAIPTLTCAISLAGCGGRDAHPIASTNATDNLLDCSAIAREFDANERQILATLKERSQAQGKNIVLGAAGALIFFPALFFMDPKSPEKVEIDALRNRNLVLTQAARAKGCSAPRSQLTEVYKKLDHPSVNSSSNAKD